jgi:hypothetical protein
MSSGSGEAPSSLFPSNLPSTEDNDVSSLFASSNEPDMFPTSGRMASPVTAFSNDSTASHSPVSGDVSDLFSSQGGGNTHDLFPTLSTTQRAPETTQTATLSPYSDSLPTETHSLTPITTPTALETLSVDSLFPPCPSGDPFTSLTGITSAPPAHFADIPPVSPRIVIPSPPSPPFVPPPDLNHVLFPSASPTLPHTLSTSPSTLPRDSVAPTPIKPPYVVPTPVQPLSKPPPYVINTIPSPQMTPTSTPAPFHPLSDSSSDTLFPLPPFAVPTRPVPPPPSAPSVPRRHSNIDELVIEFLKNSPPSRSDPPLINPSLQDIHMLMKRRKWQQAAECAHAQAAQSPQKEKLDWLAWKWSAMLQINQHRAVKEALDAIKQSENIPIHVRYLQAMLAVHDGEFTLEYFY